jgi:truncated hemoglobin YjbI
MNYKDLFQESLDRIQNQKERFFDAFYARFVGSDPAVAAKFKNTDMERQKEMLRESFAEMGQFFVVPESNPYLLTLSRIHGPRGHDIPVAMYDRWLDCLVATVAEVDPEANQNTLLAWRIVMSPGIEFMKFYRAS